MEAIEQFLFNSSDCGYYYGEGDGYGYEDGAGDGSGSGAGYCSHYGDSNGSGIFSDNYGYGCGSGSGYGYGYGYGYGDGIRQINNQKVYIIDGLQTIIESVKGYYAKGFILQDDLTLRPCYIVRRGNYFAHGDTLKKAFNDANLKHTQSLSIEERVSMFTSKFKPNTKYPAMQFFEWHNTLTGSCEFGRKQFCRENGINIETDVMTVAEFIGLVKNSYGQDVIKLLQKEYS